MQDEIIVKYTIAHIDTNSDLWKKYFPEKGIQDTNRQIIEISLYDKICILSNIKDKIKGKL